MLSLITLACSACSINGGDNQEAYVWMTVMMCLVPCIAIGSVVLWLRSEARARDRDEPGERGEAAAAGVPQRP
jgi:hypothetical protein